MLKNSVHAYNTKTRSITNYIFNYKIPEAKGCSLLISALATRDNNRLREQIVLSTNKQILDTVGFP